MSLSVATWNVNSIRSRLEHLTHYLNEVKPDVLLLQETKIEDEHFPREPIEDLGYNIALHGQKTYNGVAILSRLPLEDVAVRLPGETVDQARYIEASVSLPENQALRVASVYVPNGQSPDSEKFPYKLGFLENLAQHLKQLHVQHELLVIGGDYNVAPYPIDVFDPAGLDGTTCYHPAERERFRALLHLGYYDAFRTRYPETQAFSWWDYRQNSFQRNHGMRIDHLLLSPAAVDAMQDCTMHRAERTREKPSDHIPVMVTLKFG
jgi:exodeoxyribonuclease-3